MGLFVLCSRGMYSTESEFVQPTVAHLDQVLSWMDHSNSWNLGRRPVFVIDREADSVKHLRSRDAAGHLFLVWADDRRLNFRGGSQLLSEVALTLRHEGCFKSYGKVSIRGKMGTQSIAETEVILDQPANGTTADGKSYRIPGCRCRCDWSLCMCETTMANSWRNCVGVATSDDARSREVQVISRTSERSSDETQASRDRPRSDVRPAPAADYAAGTGISHSRTTSGLRQSRRSCPAFMTWFV